MRCCPRAAPLLLSAPSVEALRVSFIYCLSFWMNFNKSQVLLRAVRGQALPRLPYARGGNTAPSGVVTRGAVVTSHGVTHSAVAAPLRAAVSLRAAAAMGKKSRSAPGRRPILQLSPPGPRREDAGPSGQAAEGTESGSEPGKGGAALLAGRGLARPPSGAAVVGRGGSPRLSPPCPSLVDFGALVGLVPFSFRR